MVAHLDVLSGFILDGVCHSESKEPKGDLMLKIIQEGAADLWFRR